MKTTVKTVSDKLLLIIEFKEAPNFRIENQRATWCPKWKEVEDILKAAQVIEYGNKKLKELGGFEVRIGLEYIPRGINFPHSVKED